MNVKNKNVLCEQTKKEKQRDSSDGFGRASRYNNTSMKEETIAAAAGFADKLAKLRTIKQISAREMSLSLGQGASYINDIENRRYLPSMAMFFEICEYLGVTPLEFFDYTNHSESGTALEIAELAKALGKDDKDLIFHLALRLLR